MNSFASIIRKRRVELNLTQRQLATAIKCDVTYVSKLENERNDYPPSEEILCKIADKLKLDYNELMLLCGRVEKNTLAIFHELAEKYPRFMPFIQRLANDETFAINVFAQFKN